MALVNVFVGMSLICATIGIGSGIYGYVKYDTDKTASEKACDLMHDAFFCQLAFGALAIIGNLFV